MSHIFNPHRNVTADGVLITEGLRVWTNELETGVVVSDKTTEYMCCNNSDHPKAQVKTSTGWFSDHPKGNVVVNKGCYCRHNHWFRVQMPNGTTKSFDGERLATEFEGKKAYYS